MVLILKIYLKLFLLFSIIFVFSVCQSNSKENTNVWVNMFNKYVWNNKTKQATQSFVNYMKPGLLTQTVERFKVIVNTTYGRIAGERKLHSLKSDEYFYQFRGIPYAAAPVGNLRFKPPQPMKPWSDVRDAFEFGASCVQCNTRGPFGNEDCLFINVYTSEMPINGMNLKPVMFWIYGGSFQTGSAEIYGPEYLIRKDIVLVTFNYRVNVLGFFALGNKEVSGNYGLKDQLFALKWVQANIANFGGDPSRVTIFGESAGSASVQYQLLSAQSKGLFHQAIVQSGSALDPWALTKSPKDVAFKLAKSLGHNFNNTNELYLFFMQQPADLLASASDKLLYSELNHWSQSFFAFAPTVEVYNSESPFLTQSPQKLFKTGNFTKVPLIIGNLNGEGILLYSCLKFNDSIYELMNKRPDWAVPMNWNINSETTRILIGELIKYKFFDGKLLTKRSINKIVNVYSDTYFLMNLDHSVSAYLKHSQFPIYNYEMVYEPIVSYIKLRTVMTQKDLFSYRGAAHADEITLLFSTKFVPLIGRDKYVSEKMITMWTNFAKTGNPNSPDSNIIWRKLEKDNRSYLEIGRILNIKEGRVKQERLMFWEDLCQKINIDYPCYF